MTPVILIVEDDRDLLATLEYALDAGGFSTHAAGTGRRALECLAAGLTPALVLLDRVLPDMSGLDVCRRLRGDPRAGALPLVMMTAEADDADRVADDWVLKPFSLRELRRRIHAVLRRRAPDRPRPAQYGRLLVDEDGHRAWVDGRELPLSAIEFRLLAALVARSGRVHTREGLWRSVAGAQPGLTPRGVDRHVRGLRDKLGAAARYVQTLGPARYCFTADCDPAAPPGP